MLEITKDKIDFDPHIGKLRCNIAIALADGNGMMLKAKAELYGAILDELDKIVDAKIAEFAEKYGDEVIRFAHDNRADDLRDCQPNIKFVDSKTTMKNLLSRAF